MSTQKNHQNDENMFEVPDSAHENNKLCQLCKHDYTHCDNQNVQPRVTTAYGAPCGE